MSRRELDRFGRREGREGRRRWRDGSRWIGCGFAALVTAAALLVTTAAMAGDALPDPMRPPEIIADLQPDATAGVSRSLLVQAILIAEDRRLAIINDRRLRVGDEIDSARILEIAPNHVRIERAGETLKLPLVARSVKRASGSPQPRDVWIGAPAAPAATPTESTK